MLDFIYAVAGTLVICVTICVALFNRFYTLVYDTIDSNLAFEYAVRSNTDAGLLVDNTRPANPEWN